MKELTKKEWVTLPLSIEKPHRDFFDSHVALPLGISRNTALVMAIRIGGPLLDALAKKLEELLKQQYEAISSLQPTEVYEILGTTGIPSNRGKSRHERKRRKRQ